MLQQISLRLSARYVLSGSVVASLKCHGVIAVGAMFLSAHNSHTLNASRVAFELPLELSSHPMEFNKI